MQNKSIKIKNFLEWKSYKEYKIGSLSNHYDDHNDDFKKTIGLMIKTTALHVHLAF